MYPFLKTNYSIRVLVRTIEVLNCFTLTEPEKSLTELAQETGLHKSTVFRILETLEKKQWVRKDNRTGCYRLGFAIFELGTRSVYGLDFYKTSLPHLELLARSTGLSAHLVIHDQGQVLYLNKVESPGTFISQPSQIGLRMPMHCTAVGKVLLSHIEREKVELIVNKMGLPKVTVNTIVTREALYRELEQVRTQGYALDDEEIQLGLRCVAAPVRDHTKKVVAAISVSGLKANLCDERMPLIVETVIKAAEQISRDLGYRDI